MLLHGAHSSARTGADDARARRPFHGRSDIRKIRLISNNCFAIAIARIASYPQQFLPPFDQLLGFLEPLFQLVLDVQAVVSQLCVDFSEQRAPPRAQQLLLSLYQRTLFARAPVALQT